MKSVVVFAAVAFALAVAPKAGEAGILNFTGQFITGSASPFLVGGDLSLSSTFDEKPGDTNGPVDAGGTAGAASSSGPLSYLLDNGTLTFGKSGSNDTLRFRGTYVATTSGQPALAVIDLLFSRASTSPSTLTLTDTNVATMLQAGTTYSGTFRRSSNTIDDLGTGVLGGTIPVPEPGSIGLLAGLGMVCGRRIWRRRQQKKAAAAV
jgi:hypothetical protein